MNHTLELWYFRDDDDTDEPVTVRSRAALDELLEDVFSNEQPHPTVVVAHDRPTIGPLHLPDHQIKFAADPVAGVAALYAMGSPSFVDRADVTDRSPHRAWVSQGACDGEVILWLDSDAGIRFPSDAVISLDKLREALHEFMRTGQRPTCLGWQEIDVF